MAASERITQGQLENSGVAGAEDLTEGGICNRPIGPSKVRTVKQVEGFCTEIEVLRLGERAELERERLAH